jgi:hypothetical protein
LFELLEASITMPVDASTSCLVAVGSLMSSTSGRVMKGVPEPVGNEMVLVSLDL